MLLAIASVSTASANPALIADGLFHASVISFGYMAKADENRDPRLYEMITVKHNDDSNYQFNITKFEYDNAKDKYILIK